MNDDRSGADNSEPTNNGGDFDWTLALSIEERISLNLAGSVATDANVEASVESYLGRWANAFAKGDRAALTRRLAWDGISASQIANALNPAANGSTPEWKVALEQALSAIVAYGSSTTLILPARFRASNQPFPELWWAWSEVCTPQYLTSADAAFELSDAAVEDCKTELVATLAAIAADALYQEFQLSRAAPEGSTQYRRFIRSFDSVAWQMLFIKYPLLARQVGTTLLQSKQSFVQLWSALARDRQALQQQFGIDASAQIIKIEALGDTHRGGLRVRRLRFSDGKSVIFKPRQCALEARWNDLLNIIDASGFSPKLASLSYVLGSNHAWFEDIQHVSCDTPAQIAERFSQYGALIALSYVTHARDLHQDNVIVGAHGPVLIDSETVLQPQGAPLTGAPSTRTASNLAADANAPSTMARAASELDRSCLGSGLVRFPAQSATGETWDESALCGVPRVAKQQSWLGLGTDRLLPGQIDIPARAPSHRVCDSNGVLLQAPDYLAELSAGFSAAYRLLQQRKPELEAALAAMCDSQARVVLRPTRFYAAALQGLCSARVQRNGANATLILATLQRHWASAVDVPNLWPMLRTEASALMRGDVPVFHVLANSCDLLGETSVSKDAWASSAQSTLEAALQGLNEVDLARQLDWLRSSLQAQPNANVREVLSRTPLPAASALGAGALRALVLDCAEQLLAAGVRGNDAELTWLAPGHLTPNARTGRGVSHYLYDGSLGIAWFLSAAGRVLQRPELSDAARHAYAPVRRFLRDPAAPLLVAREPLGIGHGLGSVVAGLTILGQELGDSKFFEDAERALALIDARMVRPRSGAEANLEATDLEGGLAGALLGIVRLIEATGARTLLRSARPIVQRLRELQHPKLGWRGYDGRPLSGFMHGQSGISYALLAYDTLAQEGGAHALSESGFALEEQSFDAANRAWPLWLDARSDAANSPANAHSGAHNMTGTWCNGNPGILMARTAYGRKVAMTEQAHLLSAATQLYDDVPAGVDHLCCGILGRALALAQLARMPHWATALAQAGRDDAGARAQTWLAAVVQAAQLRGRYLLREDAQQNLAFQPGLYRGIAGVGFAALTLGWPERMGCVLSFQGFSR